MITVTLCTSADSPTIAGLWNARTLDAASCWYGAATVESAYVEILLSGGFEFALAAVDGAPAGFAFWFRAGDAAQLVALAAAALDVSYRLVAAYCDEGIAGGASQGWTEVGAAPSAEKTRMDTLGVAYTPIEWTAVGPDQDPATQTPLRFRADFALDTLAATLAGLIGGTP